MKVMEIARRSRDGDRGASAIMVAASLVLLMGLAAIAVDAGIAYSDRRQQSSASDVGALAAVQFAKTTLGTPLKCTGLSGSDLAACRGAVEALKVIEGTIPGQYTDADWTGCTDPDDDTLGYTQDSHISDCISFTDGLQRARVVMPGTDVDTAFAKAIGFSSVRVGAFAEAGLDQDITGGVLPFALGPSAAGTSQACFWAQDTPALDIYPCTSSVEGNFGKLDIRWYGNDNYKATSPVCSGSNQWRLAINIITGSDHPLETESTHPSSIVNDVTNCDTITNPVDEIETWTGNAASALTDGFFDGLSSPSFEGRLMCKGSGISTETDDEEYPAFAYVSTDCVNVANNYSENVDHTPLWEYVRTNAPATGSGEACAQGQLVDRASMEDCLDWWRSNDTSGEYLFDADLTTSPRFGAVPVLNNDPGNGQGSYLITDFQPIYLETVYWQCSAQTCAAVHSPGQDSSGACPAPLSPSDDSCGWTYNGNKGVEAITAFILTKDMLDPEVAKKFPYQDGTIVYNLFK